MKYLRAILIIAIGLLVYNYAKVNAEWDVNPFKILLESYAQGNKIRASLYYFSLHYAGILIIVYGILIVFTDRRKN